MPRRQSQPGDTLDQGGAGVAGWKPPGCCSVAGLQCYSYSVTVLQGGNHLPVQDMNHFFSLSEDFTSGWASSEYSEVFEASFE